MSAVRHARKAAGTPLVEIVTAGRRGPGRQLNTAASGLRPGSTFVQGLAHDHYDHVDDQASDCSAGQDDLVKKLGGAEIAHQALFAAAQSCSGRRSRPGKLMHTERVGSTNQPVSMVSPSPNATAT